MKEQKSDKGHFKIPKKTKIGKSTKSFKLNLSAQTWKKKTPKYTYLYITHPISQQNPIVSSI